jgi:glycolate oxidase iron-sulfur subunit
MRPELTASPLRDADLCVKCGMCLPHCPTYAVTRDESESPRGRIALMQALASGAIPVNDAMEAHLDGCLTCRACEVVCPALVPYGRLIDAAREELALQRPARARLPRLMAAVLTRPALRWAFALGIWLYQRTGLQWAMRALRLLGRGRLARLESLLPWIHLPSLPVTSARADGEKVFLFANCTSPLVEPRVLDAAVQLLEALGCSVEVPAAQTCCGAQHQHAGLADDARACAARNVQAFAGEAPILGVASGCTAQLLEYDGPFARRVRDIHDFIARHPNFPALRFAPLAAPRPTRVLLHTPCTQRNVVKAPDAVRRLLDRIPELQVEALDSACCGAAGSYFVTQPDMADALLEPKLARARESGATVVVSSNVGCAMHLAAGLRRAGLSARVCHPLELLDAQRARPRAAAAAAPPARPG